MKNGRGPFSTEKYNTSGFWGFWAGSIFGEDPGSQNENGRNPIYGENTHGALGLLGGVFGGDLQFPNEKWQGPPSTRKKGGGKKEKEKRKQKKGRELGKTGVVENPNTRVR